MIHPLCKTYCEYIPGVSVQQLAKRQGSTVRIRLILEIVFCGLPGKTSIPALQGEFVKNLAGNNDKSIMRADAGWYISALQTTESKKPAIGWFL